MGRILTFLLHKYISENQLYGKFQSELTSKKITLDNHLRLIQDITEVFINQQYILCIFFDMEKAFDQISQPTIYTNYKEINIHSNLYHFIQNFLILCKFKVKTGNQFSSSPVQQTVILQDFMIRSLFFFHNTPQNKKLSK